MRIGVISNPRSQRNRSEMARMRDLIESHGVPHGEIDHIASVPEILKRFAADGVELVAVSGGDGTVQAVLTALLNGNAFASPPRVAVLAAGMTNLIAADVGMKDHPAEALARLLEPDALSRGKAVERSVLSLQIDPADAPVHGMFLATAGFYRAVMLVRRRVHSLGVVRNLAAGMGIAASLLRLLLGRSGKGELLHGDAIRVDIDSSRGERRDYLLWMATTLDRFIMHLHPFWGSGPQALRYTAVPYPARRLACALWPILRGRPRRWMNEAGYHSGRAAVLELTLDCPIVFDGEFFTPRAGQPVTLRADRRIIFWQV
ncbi:MAG: diacylglycerol/lipid kinase family protein [Dongiaceae bacterium]